MGRNASECRAGLESTVVDAEPPMNGRRLTGSGAKPIWPDPSTGVVATARAEGSSGNVGDPNGSGAEVGPGTPRKGGGPAGSRRGPQYR